MHSRSYIYLSALISNSLILVIHTYFSSLSLKPHQIQNRIQPDCRNRLPCSFHHLGLGMEGNSQSRQVQHGQVIGPVSHGNHLFEVDIFLECQVFQQLCLFGPVHNITDVSAGKLSVLDFQFIPEYIVDAQFMLQVTAEIGKSSRTGWLF